MSKTPRRTDRVAVFDTTLRDGEQAPGFSMDEAGKLRVARALAALNVDIIEAGFAAASPGDARAVERVASEIEGPVICSLSRARPSDIELAGKALKPAGRSRIHIFLGTSPTHREFKLKMSPADVLRAIHEMVAYARAFADEVEFSAEDAIRTERGFLIEALSTAAQAGACVLNVPDTVGYATPEEMTALFRELDRKIERQPHVILSAHCHDDLGMATANTLAAVRGGARQVEVAMNGIGERAGNCALEEVVMAIRTRRDALGVDTGVRTEAIMAASRVLSVATNTHPPRNKAIVGANAFAHEAGIHQHGVLANPETYEIMRPQDVGLEANALVLGKHSGKHALRARAEALGFELDAQALETAFARFKDEADRVGVIDTARLTAILESLDGGQPEKLWRLSRLEIRTPVASTAQPSARIELEHAERGRVCDIAHAEGALDAAFLAVSRIIDLEARVDAVDMQYIAQEDPDGRQAADVLVEVRIAANGGVYAGRARERDIIPACVEAYLDALNNAAADARRRTRRPAHTQAA